MATLEELQAIQNELDQPQVAGQSASVEELLAIQQELDQPEQAIQITGASPRTRRAQRLEQQSASELADLRFKAQQSGVPLARDLKEIGDAPELNQLSIPSFLASAGSLFTFDDEEVGKILESQVGATINRDVEGNLIATFPSGGTFAVSGIAQNIAKTVATIGAFTPAGRAATLPGLAGKSALTQTAIEAGQAATGGELEPSSIALATAAGPVAVKTIQGAKTAIGNLRNTFGIPATSAQAATAEAKPVVSSLFSNETPTKQSIRQIIESGADDGVVARKIINGAGKSVNDPLFRQLKTQGIDDGTIAAIKGASKADKTALGKMLDIIGKGFKNKLFSKKNRPSDIVGNSLVERVKAVRNINKQAGKDVNKAAINLKGQQVDLTDVSTQLNDDLAGFGIVPDGKKLDFSGSIFDSESLKGLKKPLQDLWADFQKIQANPDGLKVHRFKKLIDNLVDFGKSSDKPLTRDIENIAKRLRGNVNESLRGLSNEYRVANDRFSETIRALDDFQSAAGSKIDLTSPNADKSLGVLSRRLLSNVQSRVALMDSITQLESTAKKLGARIDDDIFTQVMFVDELESAFGNFAPTSLQGVTEKAIKGVASTVRRGPTEIAIDVAAKAAEKARGVSEENKLKLLRQLINR